MTWTDSDRARAPRVSGCRPACPYEPGVAAAAADVRQDITTGERRARNDGPRSAILTETVDVAAARHVYTIQVVQDRTTEQQTLQARCSSCWWSAALLVLVVSFGFGTIYARRALVPIRESLANQRVALRRQREFAADASHELRTPLTVIRSSVEYLERHRDEPVATVGSALDDIDDEVRHMTALVEDLLLLARSDSGAVALEPCRSISATSRRTARRRWASPRPTGASASRSTRSRRSWPATRRGSASS